MTENGFEEQKRILAEYHDDLSLNLMNILDKGMLVATYKSKWVGYYYEYRHKLTRLESELNRKLEHQHILIKKAMKIDASDQEIKHLRLKNSTDVAELESNISDCKEHVKILGELRTAAQYFNADYNNALEAIKMEL